MIVTKEVTLHLLQEAVDSGKEMFGDAVDGGAAAMS